MANKGSFKKGDPRAGRRHGAKNAATRDVRKGFQLLMECAVPELQSWLRRVAKKDPARALVIVKDIAEFCIPKLSRTELTGPQGGPVQITRKYFGIKPPEARRGNS